MNNKYIILIFIIIITIMIISKTMFNGNGLFTSPEISTFTTDNIILEGKKQPATINPITGGLIKNPSIYNFITEPSFDFLSNDDLNENMPNTSDLNDKKIINYESRLDRKPSIIIDPYREITTFDKFGHILNITEERI